jgi:hypothetical protein
MMTRLRNHIALLLIAVLTLTGHSMALARGSTGTAGFIELCVGTEPVVIAIDENGEPTGESHICPEFSLMLQTLVETAPLIEAQAEFTNAYLCSYANPLLDAAAFVSPSARAPPVLI